MNPYELRPKDSRDPPRTFVATFRMIGPGLILAGGSSSRMGYDKSEIQYYGMPQYQRLNNLLLNHCDTVFLSRGKDQIKPTTVQAIVDQFDIKYCQREKIIHNSMLLSPHTNIQEVHLNMIFL